MTAYDALTQYFLKKRQDSTGAGGTDPGESSVLSSSSSSSSHMKCSNTNGDNSSSHDDRKLTADQASELECLMKHPLYSSPVMLCIDGLAAIVSSENDLDTNAREELGEIFRGYKESLPPNQYVCTGLELYTTHEPDLYVSMALLHSRIKQVVYQCSAPMNGALGSVYNLHRMENTNHRFRVFCYNDSDNSSNNS